VFSRICAVVLLTSTLSAANALANDAATPATNNAATAAAAPATATDSAVVASRVSAPRELRPAALPALYASFVGLQAFDVYSTTAALRQGAREANPMMRGIVGNPAVFWSVKAAATAAPMLAAERLWKRNNKVGAIAVMVAGNGLMAAIAAHNASVLRSQR